MPLRHERRWYTIKAGNSRFGARGDGLALMHLCERLSVLSWRDPGVAANRQRACPSQWMGGRTTSVLRHDSSAPGTCRRADVGFASQGVGSGRNGYVASAKFPCGGTSLQPVFTTSSPPVHNGLHEVHHVMPRGFHGHTEARTFQRPTRHRADGRRGAFGAQVAQRMAPR